MTVTEFQQRCLGLLAELGLAAPGEVTDVRRLTGGVASDIAAVKAGDETFCIKFALGKLNVSADWFAPVHRSRAEYAWLTVAGEIAPANVPKVLGWSEREHGFAMEYVAGPHVALWKSELLAGRVSPGQASLVASVLGRIHRGSCGTDFERAPFENAADFEALRIEPYLRYTAAQHPELADQLTALADGLAGAHMALVHGDVSPKNVLWRAGQPIILDAECATMGDPAFDVAFCLNHLVLKSIHVPSIASVLRQEIVAFWDGYAPMVSWERAEACQERVTALLPALMLARIDGKSPVEYLDPANRDRVRNLAIALLRSPPSSLREIIICLEEEGEQ